MQLCKKTSLLCTDPDNQHTTVIHATYVGSQGKVAHSSEEKKQTTEVSD